MQKIKVLDEGEILIPREIVEKRFLLKVYPPSVWGACPPVVWRTTFSKKY